ncbi:hypothetical protein HUO13_32440 [Saccharopolyspora erythraea]|uniref:hypothetical protein n=1 Tax=Saccharopolyspora erythraea TaxID=1836 RepID=UPI001BA90523|nr:hypothetical protein [Saccharopolyspora erythraea]QUH04863.1 hypothetical protein HUO13_32440 [Saccharopolyspora erythraea]
MNDSQQGQDEDVQERMARNAELASMPPVGGGLLSMAEIVRAVHEAHDDAPGESASTG